MSDFASEIMALGGPYFVAYWKHPIGWWTQEEYRLFSQAKERLVEERRHGAVVGHVKHITTDETVWSFGAL